MLVLGYDDNPALGRVTDQWDVACPPLHAALLDAIGPGDWFGKNLIQKVPAGSTTAVYALSVFVRATTLMFFENPAEVLLVIIADPFTNFIDG